MKTNKLFIILAFFVVMAQQAIAQNSPRKIERSYPTFFIGVQGGGQLNLQHNYMDGVTGVTGIYAGVHFTPLWGMRIHGSGWLSKDDMELLGDDGKYNYLSGNLDVLFNVVNLFSKKDNHPVNLYLLGGMGLNKALFDPEATLLGNGNAVNYIDHNRAALSGRAGLMLDIDVNRHFSINVEASANYVGSRTRHQCSYGHEYRGSEDWHAMAMIGLAYKFGKKAKTSTVATPVAVDDTRVLSLYEQMQAKVSDRMNNWMKRAKGESKADYQLRTSADSIASMRLKFEEEVSTEMAGDLINRSGAKFGRYSRKNSLATVDFEALPSIVIGMSRDEMMATKAGGAIKFRNTKYRITPDNEYEIVYTEIEAEGNDYTYDNTSGNATQVKTGADFMALGLAQRTIQNEVRLESIKEQAVQQARKENVLTDNTIIHVAAETVAAGNDKYDYKVSYSYEVKEGFSVHDDFAPGKYEAEKSNASIAMMNIIKQAFATDFASYLQPGKSCRITYVGTADALPIHGTIAYNGKYGDIVNQQVCINGEEETLSITKRNGIRSNEQLSLVRAISVKNFVEKNVAALKQMKVEHNYNIEVSKEVGGQHRRVKVEFYFPAAM